MGVHQEVDLALRTWVAYCGCRVNVYRRSVIVEIDAFCPDPEHKLLYAMVFAGESMEDVESMLKDAGASRIQ